MKVAVVGSRHLFVDDFSAFLPENTTTIISGGAKGIDTCIKQYAEKHNIPLIELIPAYAQYGRAAPLIRNEAIVQSADHVLVFWDGKSKGTQHVITLCQKLLKPLNAYTMSV